MSNEVRESLVEVLAVVYSRAKWSKIASARHPATDVFSHKIKASGNTGTVEKMLEKIAYSLGVQSVFGDETLLEHVRILKQNEAEALRQVREEAVYLTLLTYERRRRK